MTNEELVKEIQAGRDRERNLSRLWKQVRPFVCKIAYRYRAGDETEDLIHEGFLAVENAVRKYDAGQNVLFLTFAVYDIRARMNRYMEYSGTVRLPAWMAQKVQAYRKAVSEFWKSHGREPTDEEAACALGISLDQAGRWMKHINKIRAAAMEITSLDTPTSEEDAALLEKLAVEDDHEEEVLDSIFRKQMAAAVREQVDALPETWAGTVRGHYLDGLTLEEAGTRCGLNSRGAAQNAERKALRDLSRGEARRALKPFYLELYGSPFRGTGLTSFMNTWMSSTEREALRFLE